MFEPAQEPPGTGDERTTLLAFLDWHREVFELKCAGLSAEQLSERSVPPSRLSLHGLARHLADVERAWFAQRFAKLDLPALYWTDEDPDNDFNDLSADPFADLAVWRQECQRSRAIIAEASFEDAMTHPRTGQTLSLRWVVVHMIEEYARHLGHADFLRERLDGAVG